MVTAELINTTGILLTNGTSLRTDNTSVAMVTVIALIAVATVAYNLLVLAAFISDRRIWTPFNCYLINLSIVDLSIACWAMPFTIHVSLTNDWPYGDAACMWFSYASTVCTGGGVHAVMWIALDRLYAVTFPVHYRQHRSVKLSIAVCLFMWMYLTLLVLPYAILHQTVYKVAEYACAINYMVLKEYNLAVALILYTVPLVVVLCAYSMIAWKIRRNGVVPQRPTRAERGEQKLHLALARLVGVMLFLWSPAVIYFLVIVFAAHLFNPVVIAVVLCMQHASCIADPLVYHRSLPEVSRAVRNLLRSRGRRIDVAQSSMRMTSRKETTEVANA